MKKASKLLRINNGILIIGLALGVALMLTSILEAADCGKTCTPAYKNWPTGCGSSHSTPCHGYVWEIAFDGSCGGTPPGCVLGSSYMTIYRRLCSIRELYPGSYYCILEFLGGDDNMKDVPIKNC